MEPIGSSEFHSSVVPLLTKLYFAVFLDLIGPDAVEDVPSDRIYIGFSDSMNEGDWRWASGAKVSFTNWAKGINLKNVMHFFINLYYKDDVLVFLCCH